MPAKPHLGPTRAVDGFPLHSLTQHNVPVTGCLLAGGEGRRMGGQDKGLVPYRGRPLAAWVAEDLIRQTGHQLVIANRHVDEYLALMQELGATPIDVESMVLPDSPHLPAYSGPAAGILTAMGLVQTPWLMVMPCDTPHIPDDLVIRLLAEADQGHFDAVVPRTLDADGAERFHWATALLRVDVAFQLDQIFGQEERKLRVFIQSLNWSWVSFPDAASFRNINSLEMLNGGD